MIPDIKKKRRQKVAKAPLGGKQKNTIKPEPLVVALILKFTDPAGDVRLFPKDFPVEVVYGDNEKTDKRKIDNDEGKLVFRLRSKDAKKHKFLRLHFVLDDTNYIICEKRGEPAKTTELDTFKEAKKKAKNGQRFFRLPPKWNLLISDWKVTADAKLYDPAEKEKKFLLMDAGNPQSIGTDKAPVETILDPHWQYLKFEFFDRYFGHSDHANKPVSIPPVTVDGFSRAKSSSSTPTTRSNWTLLQGGDEKKIVQCLPWVIQAKSDGTLLTKPNKSSGLQLKQPKDTFVISKSATEREIKESKSFTTAETDSLKPCADRLKYYDLPETWKSQKYWSRFSDSKDEQDFFEKLAEKETKLDKPLIFSLDDIVLTDDKIAPLSVRETDRIVVFYHEFLDAVSGANKKGDGGRAGATYLKNGLYKPGPDLVEAKKTASDNAKAEEKAKSEKEARDTAVANQTKKEEDDARAAAENLAKTGSKKDDEIKADGDKAASDVATDPAAQQRIKDAGDQAATNVGTDPAAQNKINTAGTDAATKADAPLQAKNKAETDQRAIEEKSARDAAEKKQKKKEEDDARADGVAKQKKKEEDDARADAEAKQKKKEEDDARAKAEDKARKSILTKNKPASIKKAGDKAAAKVAKDKKAQARIKTAGDTAVTDVATDTDAQDRIKAKGDEAFANVATDTDAQDRIKAKGDKAVTDLPTDAAAQKRITDEGKAAEDNADIFPYSDILRHKEVTNYISDYPHWSRLVVFNGNLFDVFDKRTTTGDVIGARAAVRWVDATASGIGVESGTAINRPQAIPATAQQDKAFFILQPYYEQKSFSRSYNGSAAYERDQGFYDEWTSPIAEGEAKVSKIGRNSVAFLRTSDYKNTNEENVVFLYHPLSFDFTSEESLLNPSGVQPADIKDQRIEWLTAFTKTCADRWNGNDAVNTSRAWIVEDKATEPKTRAQAVTFIQRVDKSKAHIHIKTVDETKTSFVNSHNGTGEFRVKAGKDTTGETSDRGFAAAHELGHAGGQPDDYAPSVKGQIGFGSNNSVGAPYILDEKAMMKFNRQLRARSFWYLAEWLRSLKPFTNTKFQVEHAGYTYKVPHYNHADRTGRNYAHWNVKAKVFHAPANPVYFDSHLYFLGHDEYSRVVLPSQPDGIIVVMIKMLFDFTGYTDDDTIIKHVFSKINQKINTALNKTRIHAKFSLPGINRGGTNTFEKCLLHFSPRFDVTAGLPSHLNIKIKTPATGAPTGKTWSHNNGVFDLGPYSELDVHGFFNDGSVTDDTDLTDDTGDQKAAKDWAEFEAKFTPDQTPRKLDFRFPAGPLSVAQLSPVVTRLQNVVFRDVCKLLGLSVKSTDANYYQKADAYKGIIKACVNDNALNPTMSRP